MRLLILLALLGAACRTKAESYCRRQCGYVQTCLSKSNTACEQRCAGVFERLQTGAVDEETRAQRRQFIDCQYECYGKAPSECATIAGCLRQCRGRFLAGARESE